MTIILMIAILLSFGCQEQTTDPKIDDEENNVESEQLIKYLPLEIGQTFKFRIDTLDFNTNTFNEVGSRTSSISANAEEEKTEIFYSDEQFKIGGLEYQSYSKISISENEIGLYFDTTGTSLLIPDSLKSTVGLDLYENLGILNSIYKNNEEWIAFIGSAKFGTVDFRILTIIGQYIGEEKISVPKFDAEINVDKIKYSVRINIPDLENPFIQNISEYESYLWIYPEFGIVKIEGCGLMINPITGNSFDIADSNKVVRHTLVDYSF